MENLVRYLNGEMLVDIYGAELNRLDSIEGPTTEELNDPRYIAFVDDIINDANDMFSSSCAA